MNPIPKRKVGRTNLEVTTLGLGSAPLGWMYAPVSNADAINAVTRAYELGIRHFDTAPLYGSGVAEDRFGKVLPHFPRDEFVVSTKVGYAVYPESKVPDGESKTKIDDRTRDYSYDGAMRIVEGSLKRMGLSRIDILLIHDPDDHIEAALNGTYRALKKLRDEGVVKAIGAGMNHGDLLMKLTREADFDCVLLAGRYTLLDQSATQDFLPLAQQRGISVFIGGALNSGILANPYVENPTFNYDPASAEWVARARKLDAICKRHNVPLKAAAYQFPLAHPAVANVLIGVRSPRELDENVRDFNTPLPNALWQDMRREGLIADDIPTPQN